MHIFVKVKVASLAAEARIIRRMELSLKRRGMKGDHPARFGLSQHRRTVVRKETRLSHLAYGFLKGRDYRQMEAKTYTPLNQTDWQRVERIIKTYGQPQEDPRDLMQRFSEWKAAA
jgi:hypothetical protein